VARAEGTTPEEIGRRIWVFPTEVYDGGWGGRGVVRRSPEIMEYFGGVELKAIDEKRLAVKRRKDAEVILEAILHSLRDYTQDTSSSARSSPK
jgi:hypothetical protein